MIYEICIDSLAGLAAARAAGADRVELCTGLAEGGTTPSIGLIEAAVGAAGEVRVHVLIRPRGGDFLYSEAERRLMSRDIAAAVAAGAHGVVIGALTPDGAIDTALTRDLIAAAAGRAATFHRAFDHTSAPAAALEQLIELGVDRVLTSGQQPTAAAGADLLARLHRQAAGRIVILAGGGISAATAPVVAATGVGELHFSAREPVPEPTHSVSFGPAFHTSRSGIEAIRHAVEGLHDPP